MRKSAIAALFLFYLMIDSFAVEAATFDLSNIIYDMTSNAVSGVFDAITGYASSVCQTSISTRSNPHGTIGIGKTISGCLNKNDWKYYEVSDSAGKDLTVTLVNSGDGCNLNDLYIYDGAKSVYISKGNGYTESWSGKTSSTMVAAIDGDSTNTNCGWTLSVSAESTPLGKTTPLVPNMTYISATITGPLELGYDANYQVTSDLGVTGKWARVLIKDSKGKVVDTLTIDKGKSKTSSATGLSVRVNDVDATVDGKIKNIDLTVSVSKKIVVGIDAYGYYITSDLGASGSWAKIKIMKGGKTVDTFVINQGSSKESASAGLTIRVIDVVAKNDGSIRSVSLKVSKLI